MKKIVDGSEFIELKFEESRWVKTPTHIPQKRLVTLYSIEVVGPDGKPAPFVAHPKPYKDTLN